MTTFVLLHGGAAGAWIWRDIEQALREKGHEVLSVTFTGFAERRHLLGINNNIETHVVDVVNALEFHDIADAVLVAHSYAGAVAPGVIAAAGNRLRRAVYLDAVVLNRSECIATAMGFMNEQQAANMLAGLRNGTVPLSLPVHEQSRAEVAVKPFRMSAERQQWMIDHLCAMPTAASVTPVEVGAESIQLPVNYIAASDTSMKPVMHDRAHKLNWNVIDIDGDHAFPVGDVENTVRLLEH